MKKFLICLIALVLFGCSEKTQQERIEKCKPKTYYTAGTSVVVGLEIEGHQYLIYDGSSKGSMIHAAHCPCHDKK